MLTDKQIINNITEKANLKHSSEVTVFKLLTSVGHSLCMIQLPMHVLTWCLTVNTRIKAQPIYGMQKDWKQHIYKPYGVLQVWITSEL
jgi:hypothetical protein